MDGGGEPGGRVVVERLDHPGRAGAFTGGDSSVARMLAAPAERGKQVAVLIERQARFDEENNIRWIGVSEFNDTYGFATAGDSPAAGLDLQGMMEYVNDNSDAIVCMEDEYPSRPDGLVLVEEATGLTIPESQIEILDTGPIYETAGFRGGVLFIVRSFAQGRSLWWSDGTAAGTRKLVGFGVASTLTSTAIGELALAAETSGYRTFWTNDTPAGDGLVALREAADATGFIGLGVGLLPLDRVSPATIVERVSRLDLPVGRLTVGLGAGAAPGGLARVRRAVPVVSDGTGAAVVVGALGPRMCQVAGEVAGGVLLDWPTPPQRCHGSGTRC